MSSSAICEGPSGADRDADVGAAELQVGVGDRRHADEVVGAAEEGAEGGGEGLPAPRLQADGGGDHLLLGDVHLEEAVRVLGGEALGVGRVADLAVERDDLLVDRAEPGQGVAVGAAGRDLLAELVGRALDRRRGRSRRTAPRGGFATSTRSERTPPSSSTAASGSGERLAVLVGLVLDRGDAASPSSCGRRSPPGDRRRAPARRRRVDRLEVVAVDLLRRPSRRPRRAPPATTVSHSCMVGPRWPSRLTSTIAIRLSRRGVAGVLEGLPHRALGQLGVAAEHPDAGSRRARAARRRARSRPRSAGPGRASRSRRRPRGSPAVGWPCRREPNSRKVEQLLVVDRAGHLVEPRRAAARRGPWRRRGGRSAGFSGGREVVAQVAGEQSTAIRSAADIEEVGWPEPAAAAAADARSTRSC